MDAVVDRQGDLLISDDLSGTIYRLKYEATTPMPASSLVWQHQASGLIGVWLMNGTTQIESTYFSPNQVSDTNWKIMLVR